MFELIFNRYVLIGFAALFPALRRFLFLTGVFALLFGLGALWFGWAIENGMFATYAATRVPVQIFSLVALVYGGLFALPVWVFASILSWIAGLTYDRVRELTDDEE